MRRNRLIGGIMVITGAFFVVVGSILPWAVLESAFGNIAKNGTQGDGMLTLIAGVVVLVMGALMLVMERYSVAIILGALGGLGCSVVAIIDLVDLASRTSGVTAEFVKIKAGAGIYMVLVAGLIVIAGVVIDRIGAPRKSTPPAEAAPVLYVCPYCRNPVKQTDRFCSHCGAQFPQQ